jgi:hypothetical protein
LLGVFIWLVRSIIDHRRWLRLSRVQAEVHTKLLDRLTTNEDLLSYIQSPAGRRFLESAPITHGAGASRDDRAGGRIIWSLQAVLCSRHWARLLVRAAERLTEAAEGFFIIGVLAMSLGVGFTASRCWPMSFRRGLGLVPKPKSTEA